ncbi:MAG TPA: LamG domain-containing protein [Nitrospira sp.]|nr:LamG domain-containing protein [Nitrospira sp.]HNL88564.1 LamG domain-containing protein [Nitrospira sp.]
MSTYYFFPWVRSGMARLITTPDLGQDTLPNVKSGGLVLPVTVSLNGKKVEPQDAGTPQLYGPGEVVGLDVREIIRTGPLHLTPDYPPERFAFIEFDRPDFPWLFSPGAPSKEQKKADRLRPWLILVVVDKSQAAITTPTDNGLPVLSCPIQELPPTLNESWAWAHAVYAGDEGMDHKTVESRLHSDPADRNLSRLLCPRKLTAHTSYEACLVPAFEAGRKAGLGQEVDPDNEPLTHWSFAKNDEVKLPVYYHWSFSTGDEDQFIKLAEQLRPLSEEEKQVALSGIAGDMDLRDPGNGIDEFENLPNPSLPIPSALRMMPDPPPPGTASPARPETPQPIRDKLTELLTTPHDTVIPPPVYGSWHAPPHDVSAQLNTMLWLKTLNLDPRYRVAAALGTSIIQKEQEHILAAVWKEVGELQAANELLQRKQLACCVTDSIYKKRLRDLSPYTFLQVTEPVPLSVNDPLDFINTGFRELHLTQTEKERGRPKGALSKASTSATSATSAQQTDQPLTSFAAAVLADRPVAYYRFNESPGSTTIRDSSGKNNQGVLDPVGVTFGVPSPGVDETAAKFDGEKGRIIVQNSESLNPPHLTMEALVRWHGPQALQPTIYQRILEKSSFEGLAQYGFGIVPDGRVTAEFRTSSAATSVAAFSVTPIDRNVATHIAVTYDGGTIRIYLNGELNSTTPAPGSISPKPPTPQNLVESGLGIGNETQRARPFHGLMDELALYGQALSSDRVRAHMLAIHSMTPLEQVAIIPQFRRMTRAGRSWSVKGTISEYDPDHIAPPPGVRESARPVTGNSLSKRSLTAATTAGTDISHLVSLKQQRLAQIDPRMTFVEEVAHRIRRSAPPHLKKAVSQERFQQHGELGPFTYAPKFSTPMYEPLRDQFPDMLLPGLDKIPNDRATLLTVNAPFIEAYMVGLNHELSREFLWREFPTMVNVTYFQQFWDARGAENSQDPDISKPIGDWANGSDLGGHLASGRGGDLTFLLIRSELIIRYPNALIYARRIGVNSPDPLLPILRFSPITGVALVGFPIANIQEWKFFVEEHFTEPYMGPKQGDSDDSEGPDTPYVSFVKTMSTGKPLYKSDNSAHLAADILRDRYFREIKVIMEPSQTPN